MEIEIGGWESSNVGQTFFGFFHDVGYQRIGFPEQQFLFQEMLNVITEAGERLERYDAQIPRVLPGWRWEPVVNALMSLRGMAVLTAATLVAEMGDLRRFATARQLMGYLGLVPSEDSTGDERHQSGITKMGNGVARRALIEAKA